MEVPISLTKEINFRIVKKWISMLIKLSVTSSEVLEHSWASFRREFTVEDNDWEAFHVRLIFIFVKRNK